MEYSGNKEKISAGSYDLNTFLHGGYEKDIITMIGGPAGSGKTTFCELVAVSQAKKGKKVVYMDSEGGFSIERVKQLLDKDVGNLDFVLQHILLLKPTNFIEQKKYFLQLLKYVKQKDIGVVIVDGMTMLYRLAMSDSHTEEGGRDFSVVRKHNFALAEQMGILAEISRKQNIPVIVTNQVYSDFLSFDDLKSGKQREVHFVGGDLLKYWSKCIIELQFDYGKRKALLKKHRSLPEKEFAFQIVQTGIKRRGWI